MKKKGSDFMSSTTFKVLFIVFVFVLVVYGVISLYKKPLSFINFFPGFNQTIPAGTSIVGVNLETNELMYFIGEERWRKINDADKSITLDKYEFVPNNFKNELTNFYFNTPRKPEKLTLEINNWRYWEVVKGGNGNLVVINPKTKKAFIEQEKINYLPQVIYINYFGNPTSDFLDYDVAKNLYVPFFADIEIEKYREKFPEVISWADSILAGGKCEKLLALNLKENKQDKTYSYGVRRTEEYVFIDLNKPITLISAESYSNEDCFGFENYDDSKIQNVVSKDSLVEFRYATKNLFGGSDNVLRWEDGKTYLVNSGSYKVDADIRTFYLFLSTLSKGRTLNNAFFDSSKGQGVSVGGSRVNVSFINGEKFGELNNNEISRFLYVVLTEYYKGYILRGEGF